KFWRYHKEYLFIFPSFTVSSSYFELVTSIEQPHKDAIKLLKLHPSIGLAVSCSDESFKVWSGGKSSWTCRSVGTYKKKKCGGAAFSSEDTLLAIAYEEVLMISSRPYS